MIRKTKTEMLETILEALRSRSGITETSPGSVARTFSEIITEEFYPFYEELDLMVSMSFVSSASGSYLDLIGELLNCSRNENETDSDYRARITNQVYVIQSANIIALRLKALQVPGVADVSFKKFTSGTGSFTCYVTPEVFPVDNRVLSKVEEVLLDTAAYGYDVTVKVIEQTPIDLSLNIIFNAKTTELEKKHIIGQISTKIKNYVNNLSKGETLVINEIIRLTMETSDRILDMNIYEIYVGEKNYFVKNISPAIDEQYYLRKLNIA